MILAPALALLLFAAVAGLFGRSMSPLTWYVTRAAGLTLYLLLWVSVMLGLGMTTKAFDRMISRGNVYSLHTFVTQLSYGFLGLHILSLVADTHIPFGPASILIPFSSRAAEPWTVLGIISMYILIIIVSSSFARRVVDFDTWHLLHLLAFPLYCLSLLHGIGAGTDSAKLWTQSIYLVTGLAVFWLVVYRVLRHSTRSAPPAPAHRIPSFDRFTLGGIHRTPR